jgi:hypothetical protein
MMIQIDESTWINENTIRRDEKSARVAALLYYLIKDHVNSPIARKRRDATDLVWEEANNLIN